MSNFQIPKFKYLKNLYPTELQKEDFSSLFLVLSQVHNNHDNIIDLDISLVEAYKDLKNELIIIEGLYNPEYSNKNLIDNLNLFDVIAEFKKKPFWEDLSIKTPGKTVKENRKRQGFFLQRVHPYLINKEIFFVNRVVKGSKIRSNGSNIYKKFEAELCFIISKSINGFEMKPLIKISGFYYPLDTEKISFWFLRISNCIYKWKDYETAELFKNWGNKPSIEVKTNRYKEFFNEIVYSIHEQYEIVFSHGLNVLFDKLELKRIKFFIKIEDQILKILPLAIYDFELKNIELNFDFAKVESKKYDNTYYILKRNEELELNAFYDVLEYDARFKYNYSTNNFYINIESIDQEWLTSFIVKLENKSEIYKVYYVKEGGSNKPIEQEFTSGIDWLDKTKDVKYSEHELDFIDLVQTHLYPTKNSTKLPSKSQEISTDEIQIITENWKTKYESLLKEIPEYPVPYNINAELRDYQIDGFRWLRHLYESKMGGILADDMGLGKTLQILTLLQSIKNEKGNVFALIVVPKTLLFNWENERKKFAPNLTMYAFYGEGKHMGVLELKKFNIIITTYQTLVNDTKKIQCLSFDYLILDEAQNIKNPSTSVFKAVKKVEVENKITATGTPIENRIIDLFAQFDFLNPGFLGNYESFKKNYYYEIEKKNNVDRLIELRSITSPLILRRTKAEVLTDLPPKEESIIYCDMEKEQRVIYDDYYRNIREQVLNSLSDNEKVEKGTNWHVLRGILTLRQLCASTSLVTDNYQFEPHSIKLKTLENEILRKNSKHKVLIFSQFLGILSDVRTIFEKHRIQYEYLDGQSNKREDKVKNFQENKNIRGFICSLKAGGVGINLTSADTVYILDPWWNPSVENQAIDRCYRWGQKNPVNAYRLICRDTIEEKIMLLQQKKLLLADSIYGDGQNVKSCLTKKEILMLFS